MTSQQQHQPFAQRYAPIVGGVVGSLITVLFLTIINIAPPLVGLSRELARIDEKILNITNEVKKLELNINDVRKNLEFNIDTTRKSMQNYIDNLSGNLGLMRVDLSRYEPLKENIAKAEKALEQIRNDTNQILREIGSKQAITKK